MSGLLDKIRDWMSGGKKGGTGVLGEPGTTQRPGPSSGEPGDGPAPGEPRGPGGTA